MRILIIWFCAQNHGHAIFCSFFSLFESYPILLVLRAVNHFWSRNSCSSWVTVLKTRLKYGTKDSGYVLTYSIGRLHLNSELSIVREIELFKASRETRIMYRIKSNLMRITILLVQFSRLVFVQCRECFHSAIAIDYEAEIQIESTKIELNER